MAKKSKKKLSKGDLDLNKDGVFDEEDKQIAGSVLASKIDKEEEKVGEEEVSDDSEVVDGVPEEEEEKVEGKIAVADISRKYRKGDVVPEEQIAIWKQSGIDYKIWF